MIKYTSLFIILFAFLVGQTATDQTDAYSINVNKEFSSLEEALKNPQKVYRLNLSNQAIKVLDLEFGSEF